MEQSKSPRQCSDEASIRKEDAGIMKRKPVEAAMWESKRLEIEEALRQSEIRYRVLVEAAPSAISIIDKDGQYKYLNPKFETMFGYDLDDIPTGREWFAKAFPDPSYRELVIADWKSEFSKLRVGEVRPRTYQVTCKDGTVKVTDFRSVALATGDWLIFYEDISKRVQAEEAFVKSEEQYRLLVKQIPAVVYKGYADGRVEFFDRKIESLTGYMKEDFDTGLLKWTDLVLQEDFPGAREAVQKALRGNGSYVREYRIRKQDGGILWIQGRGQIFRNAAGQLDYISGVLFDISDRKGVEEALRQSELKYRTLVEQIPAVVFQGYMDWSIDYFDRKIEALSGYAKEDFDSRRLKWIDLIPAEEMDYVKQTFVEALKTDRSYVREHRIRKKNGEYAWVQCRGQIFCDSEGKAEYVRGVVFDITARKQNEKALKDSEARYRFLAENLTDVIWTSDMNLNPTYVSPSSEFLTGYSPDEIIQRGIETVLTPLSLEKARRVFAEDLQAESQKPREFIQSKVIELEVIRKDGSTVWTEVKASFLRDEQQRPVGFVGVTRDISKRKEVELALQRRDAILEAVSFAAEKLLKTESWEKDIQNILANLGKSSEASRVYIFENHSNNAGEILASQRYEWTAPGVEPQIDNPGLQNLSWQEAGFGRWEEQLTRGQIIAGEVREFPSSEQELLVSQNIKSIVAVPIFVGPQWWGIIGFDECLNNREWSAVELETLKAAASTLGAAILRERAEQSLRISEKKLRSLTAQLITAQEDERKRLAFELHDDLGQALMVLKMQLQAIQRKASLDRAEGDKLESSIDYINEIIDRVRRLSRNLRPSILDELGLAAALKYLFKELSNQNIRVTLDLDDTKGCFSEEAQLNIFRIFQESFSNIAKHAQATEVSVIMKRQDGSVAFQVEDNGRGFDQQKAVNGKVTERGLGLTAMDERARMLGGSFNIWSQEGWGTKITIVVPIREEIS